MIKEGYIKFAVHLKEVDIVFPETLSDLNAVRSTLHDKGMIGVLPGGIGFGNVSVKPLDADHFFISGSATGGKRILEPEDYCRVDRCSAARNEVFCSGRIRGSSETLSHDAVYHAKTSVGCVIHIHHKAFFKKLLVAQAIPATSKEAEFGTPEMAEEIQQLVKAHNAPAGILVMTGHEDGIIGWGSTVSETYELLINNFTGMMG